MAGHESNAGLQVLGSGLCGQLEHALAGRAIYGDGLLQKDVEFLLDRILEMNPAKRRWSGEDGHVSRLQTIHGFLVGIEPDEAPVLGHLHLRRDRLGKAFVAAPQTMLVGVGHGH